jgi:trigger factor
MQANVEELENHKVKLRVAVPAPEFERAIDQAFRTIAREIRLPGFRPGKAPRKVLEARVGLDAARQQAFQDSVPEYYADAVLATSIDPIAAPEITIVAGADGGDVEFDAVVEVRPIVSITGYDALQIALEYTPTDDEAVRAQIDRIRDQHAALEDSNRPLAAGDFATIDISGRDDEGEELDGLVATDFLYPVGSGMIVSELDDNLRGTKPGEIIEFRTTLGDNFGERAGLDVQFRVIVKGTQEKVLPDLTDEWVDEHTEFDTVDALRADVTRRTDMLNRVQAQMALRDKVLEVVADLVPIPAPETLINDEVRRRIDDFAHRLSHQGISIDQYLAMTGQDAPAFIESIREGAEKAVLADLALRAVVSAEAIEPSEDDVEREIARLAEQTGQKVEKVRRDLVKQGLMEAVRSDLARGLALQFLVDHATAVDGEGNPLDLTIDLPPTDPASEQTSAPQAEGTTD